MRWFLATACCIKFICAAAQTDTSGLFRTLRSSDSLLFNVGFNQCDIKQFEDLLSDNFEFYHDEAGVTYSKAAFITGVKNNVCNLSYRPSRRLVENSLKTYPLKKDGILYGATQTGEHQFYATEKGREPYLTSTAKFTHVWMLEHSKWKLTRCLSYDHQSPAVSDTIDESILFTNRTETEKWLKKNHIPALGIGYINEGKIREITVYSSDEKGIQYPRNAIFNVASLTKPVTALITLELVNSGKWNLDEPICKYWTDPDVANDTRSKLLTTRHILSHQSGFPNWRYQDEHGKLKFDFEPGTKYQYSGEGYEYLRKAIESKFNKPLEQLGDELIFTPLQMKDTKFHWDSSTDESRFANWYKKDGTRYKTYKNSSANAADDLQTTVEDYTKFILWVMNGAGLSRNLYEQMTSRQVKTRKSNQYIGLGWFIDVAGINENIITHGGDDIGVHTIVFIAPDSRKGLVIFTNCDNGIDAFIPVIRHYLGQTGQAIIDVETK